jgi:hypothetical protein
MTTLATLNCFHLDDRACIFMMVDVTSLLVLILLLSCLLCSCGTTTLAATLTGLWTT